MLAWLRFKPRESFPHMVYKADAASDLHLPKDASSGLLSLKLASLETPLTLCRPGTPAGELYKSHLLADPASIVRIRWKS